jgi:hypothetical protein
MYVIIMKEKKMCAKKKMCAREKKVCVRGNDGPSV